MTEHDHPYDDTYMEGYRLKPGVDRIREGDYWAAMAGDWRPAPKELFGAVLGIEVTTVWVRPTIV